MSDPDETNQFGDDDAQSHDEREVTPLPGVAEAEAVERAEAEENDSSEDEDDQKDPAGFLAQGLVAGPPDIHH